MNHLDVGYEAVGRWRHYLFFTMMRSVTTPRPLLYPPPSDFSWGSATWKLHTWQKVLTVRHVHHLGFSVVQSDMDVVWFRWGEGGGGRGGQRRQGGRGG